MAWIDYKKAYDMKSGKRHTMEGVELPNKIDIRTLGEKEPYKYLDILKADTIKQQEMKEKILKEYLRKPRELLEIKFYRMNLVKGINTWAVSLVRYSGPFLKWTREKLKQMDQRIRKLMTMTLPDFMCQEERGEDDLLALKIALTYQYNDSKTT